ncbi:MAG: winged helix-turn-helix transcriptional regulator [Bacteroidetes bacterium]|nr:winged helix-turn-helix transcriptional regulator [Bacteroidota bacterium]
MQDDKDRFYRQAQIFKALAHSSRLCIIDRLSRGECTPGELTKLIGSDASTVSKHLAVLRAQGIVRERRAGSEVYYRLLMPCVLGFFDCIAQVHGDQ